jgi:tetratricopeptide (TPR) repeat protein
MPDAEDARELFKKGQRLLDAPVTEEGLVQAGQLFENAYALDSSFYRAIGWQGYVLVRQFEEGYVEADVLEPALSHTLAAVENAPSDYDNHWALAIVRLYRREWAASDQSYQDALRLDIEGNIHLRSDYSVALNYFGRSLEALRYSWMPSGLRDWHKWNTAWTFFFLARRDFEYAGDSAYFDLALREIRGMTLPTNHPRNLKEAQLLVAAIQCLRGDTSRAQEAMGIYSEGRGHAWTVEQEMTRAPFDDGNPEAAASRDFWANASGQALELAI